jgi:hypothetical protein
MIDAALFALQQSGLASLTDHLYYGTKGYQNMHLRKKKSGDLQYLEMLRISPLTSQVEGKLSGPSLYMDFFISSPGGTPQLNIREHLGDSRILNDFIRGFQSDIESRIASEVESSRRSEHYSNYSAGQFYLRRFRQGMSDTHKNCFTAVANGVLDQRFVSSLESWKFQLLHP